MNQEQIKAAREALSSLDDYASMSVGVNAIGPHGVLEAFIGAVEHSLSAQDEVISDLNAINRAMQHMGDQLNEMDVVEEEDVAIVTPGFEAIARLIAAPSPSLAVRDVVDAPPSAKKIHAIYKKTHEHCYDGAAAGNFLLEYSMLIEPK